MASSSPCLCSSLLLLLMIIISTNNLTHAASFNESCNAGDSPCQALLAYRVSSTSIANISTLFSVSALDILSANGFPPNTNVFAKLVNETVKIMVPCPCVSNRRAGNLLYTLQFGDWLSKVADEKYGKLVTYNEIAAASAIPDPDHIVAGQNVTIPYPCSCRNDMLPNRNVLFMSYVVQEGEIAGMFARQYGISVSQLGALNPGVEVKAGAVIKLPVDSCKADFDKDAVDANLTVASGSYVTTANGCVQCTCKGNALYCTKSPLAPSTCSLQCQGSQLQVGSQNKSSSQGGCLVQSCVYNGYSSPNGIFTKIQSTLSNVQCQSVEAPPPFAYAPEEQGVPEAVSGGPAAGILPPESSNKPDNNTGSGGQTAPPPDSASTRQYFGVQQVFMSFLLLVLAV